MICKMNIIRKIALTILLFSSLSAMAVEYDVTMTYNQTLATLSNEQNTVYVSMKNLGTEDAKTLDLTIDAGGVKSAQTVAVELEGGFNMTEDVAVKFLAPEAQGKYSLTISIDKVNGQPNGNSQTLVINAQNVTKKAPYKVLLEEFTGTICPWCIRGWVGMEEVKTHLSDICVPIAVHQYNINNTIDPMKIALDSYAPMSFASAPTAKVNRKENIDPYFGTTKRDNLHILDDIRQRAVEVAKVAVDVEGEWNSDSTAVNAKACLEFLGDFGNYNVEFVLTADSLTSKLAAWRQQNAYAASLPSANSIDENSPMAEFCKGGERAKNPVSGLVFNDAAISSSYVSGVNQAGKLPTDYKPGDVCELEYTIAMPTSDKLLPYIVKKEIFVNVIVTDATGRAVNAARARVGHWEEEETAISNATTSANKTVKAIYSASGQRVTDDYHGARIIVYTDGTAIKVIK